MPKPILFFDGQCPLCRREIAHYQRLDGAQRVDWQDIFSDTCPLSQYGLDRVQAMQVIHAVNSAGQLCKGLDAFMIIWRELPYYRHLARLIEMLHLSRPVNAIYHRFARRRFQARCKDGCQLPPSQHP